MAHRKRRLKQGVQGGAATGASSGVTAHPPSAGRRCQRTVGNELPRAVVVSGLAAMAWLALLYREDGLLGDVSRNFLKPSAGEWIQTVSVTALGVAALCGLLLVVFLRVRPRLDSAVTVVGGLLGVGAVSALFNLALLAAVRTACSLGGCVFNEWRSCWTPYARPPDVVCDSLAGMGLAPIPVGASLGLSDLLGTPPGPATLAVFALTWVLVPWAVFALVRALSTPQLGWRAAVLWPLVPGLSLYTLGTLETLQSWFVVVSGALVAQAARHPQKAVPWLGALSVVQALALYTSPVHLAVIPFYLVLAWAVNRDLERTCWALGRAWCMLMLAYALLPYFGIGDPLHLLDFVDARSPGCHEMFLWSCAPTLVYALGFGLTGVMALRFRYIRNVRWMRAMLLTGVVPLLVLSLAAAPYFGHVWAIFVPILALVAILATRGFGGRKTGLVVAVALYLQAMGLSTAYALSQAPIHHVAP